MEGRFQRWSLEALLTNSKMIKMHGGIFIIPLGYALKDLSVSPAIISF